MSKLRLSHFQIAILSIFALLIQASCSQPYKLYAEDGQGNRQYDDGSTYTAPPPPVNDSSTDRSDTQIAPGYAQQSISYAVSAKQKKVDVLFVVDSSGSMAEEQQNVINSFSQFLQGFLDEEVDYHIGVISTDTIPDASHWSNSTYNGFVTHGAGTLLYKVGNQSFVNNGLSESEVRRQFTDNVNLGLNGSGYEMGLMSIMSFLDTAKLASGGYNQNFMRKDALFSMIVVSDEDESTSNSDFAYIKTNPAAETARLNTFKSTVIAMKPGRPDLIRFDAVVAPSVAACPTVGSTNGVSGTGDTYIKAAEMLKGSSATAHVTNICQDFALALGGLSKEMAAQIERRFVLEHVPEAGSVKVWINGSPAADSGTAGFQFQDTNNSVYLNGMNLESLDSYDLKITYTYKL